MLFSTTAAPFYIPTNNAQEFWFIHILTKDCYFLGVLLVCFCSCYWLQLPF